MREQPSQPVRIEPNSKWFGNVRTMDQRTLEKLRIELKEQVNDSYTVLLNKNQIPMSLIEENNSAPKINVLDYETYEVSNKHKIRLKIPFFLDINRNIGKKAKIVDYFFFSY